MTHAQLTQLRAALHDLASAQHHLTLAAHLTVRGQYNLYALQQASELAGKRFERAMELARNAIEGQLEVFSLAIVVDGEILEVP